MGGKKFGTVNIQEIALAAAVEALKLQKNEERMRKRKNRFHNKITPEVLPGISRAF